MLIFFPQRFTSPPLLFSRVVISLSLSQVFRSAAKFTGPATFTREKHWSHYSLIYAPVLRLCFFVVLKSSLNMCGCRDVGWLCWMGVCGCRCAWVGVRWVSMCVPVGVWMGRWLWVSGFALSLFTSQSSTFTLRELVHLSCNVDEAFWCSCAYFSYL